MSLLLSFRFFASFVNDSTEEEVKLEEEELLTDEKRQTLEPFPHFFFITFLSRAGVVLLPSSLEVERFSRFLLRVTVEVPLLVVYRSVPDLKLSDD